MALGARRFGAGITGSAQGEYDLRARLRADYRLRNREGRRALEDDRHGGRRRHGHLAVGSDRRHRPALLHARGAWRSGGYRGIFPCLGRITAHRRDRRVDGSAAGNARREAGKTHGLRGGAAAIPDVPRSGPSAYGQTEAQASQDAADAGIESQGQGNGSAFRDPADHGRAL